MQKSSQAIYFSSCRVSLFHPEPNGSFVSYRPLAPYYQFPARRSLLSVTFTLFSITSYLQVILLLSAHDPGFALCLRVNKKRIARCFGNDDTVLNRELIAWETMEVPLADLRINKSKHFLQHVNKVFNDWGPFSGLVNWTNMFVHYTFRFIELMLHGPLE